MPIKSYLVYPHKGKKNELESALSSIKECGVIPSTNAEILVLITDTETLLAEGQLQEKLNAIESMKMLSMVSGFNNK